MKLIRASSLLSSLSFFSVSKINSGSTGNPDFKA
jgi:hypothetical protein